MTTFLLRYSNIEIDNSKHETLNKARAQYRRDVKKFAEISNDNFEAQILEVNDGKFIWNHKLTR